MKILLTAFLLCTVLHQSALAQVVPEHRPRRGVPTPGFEGQSPLELPKFDIDFPGGTPTFLVELIQDTLKELDPNLYLNAIIPDEFKNEKLPPLKMRNVDVQQLFKALEFASLRSIAQPMAMDAFNRAVTQSTTSYGFQTTGPITPQSIWYFHVQKPTQAEPIKIVRYYQLAPYLAEFTMDDIGSAIEAGWNMLGETNTPKLNFHQDTKLLIAVGVPQHLEMISSMLKELGAGMTNRPAAWNPKASESAGKPDSKKP